MTITGGVMYKKFMIFVCVFFLEYLGDLLTFLREIFLVAGSYLVVVIDIKVLIMGAPVTLETRLKVPILAVF